MKKLLLLAMLFCSTAWAQVAPLPNGRVQFSNTSGVLVGGLVYTCTGGSTCPGTPAITYTDYTAGSQNTNPVVLDGNGTASIWLTPNTSYKFVVEDANGVVQWTMDGISVPGSTTSPSFSLKYLNGICFADQFANIQAAITACGTTGAVLIPSSYAGSDTYTNPNSIEILDLRHGALGTYSVIQPSWPANSFPMGNDLNLRIRGPADFWLDDLKVYTTSATALTGGTAAVITVGAVSVGNTRATQTSSGTTALFSTSAGIILGRETATEETVTYSANASTCNNTNQASGTYSVVDATTLCVRSASNHSGTYDIEQIGNTLFGVPFITLASTVTAPSQATNNAPMRFYDGPGHVMFYTPGNEAGSFPYSAIRIVPILTGAILSGINNNGDFRIQNQGTGSVFKIMKSSDASTLMSVDDSGNTLHLGQGSFGTLSPNASTKLELYAANNSLQLLGALQNSQSGTGTAALALGVSDDASETQSFKAGIGLTRSGLNGRGTIGLYNHIANDTNNFTTSDAVFTSDASGATAINSQSNSNITLSPNGAGITTTDKQIQSTLTTGTAPFSIASTTQVANLTVGRCTPACVLAVTDTTPVANLNASPVTYSAGGTQVVSPHIVQGECVLGTNCSVTLTGAAAFADTNYICMARDTTTAANVVTTAKTSSSQVDFTGTGTDGIEYFCNGR